MKSFEELKAEHFKEHNYCSENCSELIKIQKCEDIVRNAIDELQSWEWVINGSSNLAIPKGFISKEELKQKLELGK